MKSVKEFVEGRERRKHFFTEKSQKRNNLLLLVFIILMITLTTLSKNTFINTLLISALIFSGISSLNFRYKILKRLTFFGLITLSVIWIDFFLDSNLLKLISFIILLIFLIYITFSMISHVVRSKNVKGVIILNAINSYLLIGIIGAFLFALIDVVNEYFLKSNIPAINFGSITDPTIHDFIYFSFVTLTTLGYGEITPIAGIAKSLAIILSLTGQIYLTIIIALLIGKFLTRPEKQQK
ncbi:MAG: two pore domain potassium channel family protein [Melioribacteraceae bacterium]|nr:two pore domain potassium channel family protein [Melioribacteraceae bacterium]